MIRISRLTKSYGSKALFADVSLTIGEKEKIGLIGRNGSGKSTFLKMLLGEEGYDEGIIDIPSRIIVRALEQHLTFSETTILRQVSKHLPKEATNEEWKAQSILMGLGFREEDFVKAPEDFSSGMQVRIRLAEALVLDSHVLLLDEPTNYLDILSLRWLERFLQSWNGSFVLVTHDQAFMERVVTHTVGIHRGKMRKLKGLPQKMLVQIEKEEVVYEKTRQNREKKDVKTKEFIRTFRAGARSAGLVQSRIKSLAKQEVHEKLEKLPQIVFHFQYEHSRANTLLQATNIVFSYEADMPLISGFSLKVHNKERIAIIGRNGKGKSTLLKLLIGELKQQSGSIKPHVDLRIGYFSASDTGSLRPENTILSELMALPNVNEREVRSVCGALLFPGNDVKKSIASLSGGEKSRVCFAKVLLTPVQLLVLDEPTNHLDMESCQALTAALKEFPGAVLWVTHDETMLSALASRLVVFDQDTITVQEKTYDEFLQTTGFSEEGRSEINWKKYKSVSSGKQQYLEEKERQKQLRKLTSEQKKLEKHITKLEEKQSENTTLLQQAYADSDRDAMEKLGKEAKKLAESIADGYKELEEILLREECLKKS